MTQGRDHMPSNATSAARRPAKIVVVGAGPAGSTCALELRRHGVGDVVLVDRSEYPRRKVCGSGLSPLALGQLAALDLLDTMRPLHIEMRGLRVVGPGGTEVRLEGAKGAWVVPRTELDHRLVQAAIAEGVTMREGMRVTEIVRDAEGEARGVKTPDEEIEADLVVIANGSPSSFERDEHPREGIRTIVGWYQGRLPDQLGMMIWDRRLGGYYAWAFPEPGDVINIGLTLREDHEAGHHLRDLFTDILGEHFGDYASEDRQIGRWAGHPATVTHRIGPIAASREIFVGEAARLVCPGTVEGISFAMHSGRLAANAIRRSFDVERGLSLIGQKRYQVDVATQLLPTFLAGEALYQVMRQPRLVAGLTHLFDPATLAKNLSKLLGERPPEA
jgi:flavin-dependent dehydrogenase